MAGYDRLTPEGKKLLAEVKKLGTLQVRVGYQRGTALTEDDSGRPVDYCDIAMWNELGTSRGIPSRPFLRNSVDMFEDAIDNEARNAVQEMIGGMTAEQVLNELGVRQKARVQVSITDGDYTPNARATVRKKGSDKPLIDTGIMRASVQYVVCKKGEFD